MSTAKRIAGIQYLRGLAALGVVISHADTTTSFPKYFGGRTLDGVLYWGALGVPLFFMISGFIISVVSLAPDTTAPRVTVARFAYRRAARILPVMWIAIIAYAGMRLAGGVGVDVAAAARAMVLWPVGALEPNVIWTLRQEAIFYLLFAATFLGPRILRWLAPLWFVSPVLYALAGGGPGAADSGWTALARTLFHPSCLQFGMGMATGLVWLKWSRVWHPQIPGLWLLCLVWLVVVMAVFPLFPPPDRLTRDFAAGLAFLPLLVLAAHSRNGGHRAGLLLGDASFSIYLFHGPAISAALVMVARFAPGAPPAAAMILSALAGLALGFAAHFLIERPVLARLRPRGLPAVSVDPPVRRADAW